MGFNISQLGADGRDGPDFDLIEHLNNSIARGSVLAEHQKRVIENYDLIKANEFDSKIRDHLSVVHGEMIELISEMDEEDLDIDQIVQVLNENELNDYFIGSELVPTNLSPKTLEFFFNELINSKNKENVGAFGRIYSDDDHGYNIAHYPSQLVLSPLISRNFLWNISLAGEGSIPNKLVMSTTVGFPFLAGVPDYLISIGFSPCCSINLLNCLLSEDVSGLPYHLWMKPALLINPVSDIWLLTQLDTSFMGNSIFENDDGLDDMSTEVEKLSFGVLGQLKDWSDEEALISGVSEGPLSKLFDTLKSIFKQCQDQGLDAEVFVTLILALRIISEFKSKRANWQDHITSESSTVRLVIYCNPEIDQVSRESIGRNSELTTNIIVTQLVTNFWIDNSYQIIA